MNYPREGGPLKGDTLRKQIVIKGFWKSFILILDEFNAAVTESKKLKVNKSQVGKLLSAIRTWDVFLKVRSFNA